MNFENTNLARVISEKSGIFLLLGLLVCVMAGVYASELKFDTSYKAFLEPENPHLMQLDNIEREFNAGNDNLVILIKTHQGDFLESERIAYLQQLSSSFKQALSVDKIDALPAYQFTYGQGDEVIVEPLADLLASGADGDVNQAWIRKQVLEDPFVVGRLLSNDATVTAIIVELALPEVNHTEAVVSVGNIAHQMKQEIMRKHPEYDVYLSGTLMFDNAMLSVVMEDIVWLFPVIILIVLVLCFGFFGSLLPLIPIGVVIAMSSIGVAGIAGALGININSVSSMAFIIVAILAVADSIHLLSSYALARSRGELNADAIVHSMTINFKPMSITSLTTAIGFLSLLFSESPPFHQLGWLVSAGVIIAWLVTVLVLPWFVIRLNIGSSGWISEKNQWFYQMGDWVSKNRLIIVLVFFPVSLMVSGFLFQNNLNDDSLKWFDQDTEFRQSVDFASENIASVRTITFSFNTGQAHGVNQPHFLKQVDQFDEWLINQPEVGNVYSFTDIYKRMNMAFNENDRSKNVIPETSELASQYLLMYQLGSATAGNTNALISDDESRMRVVVSLKNLPNKEYIAFESRCYGWMKQSMPHYLVHGASVPIMFAMVGQNNLQQMLYGGVLTLLFITISLIAAFRSWMIGLCSIIPNVLPIAVAYGCWGIFYGELNMAASIMFSVSIGLVVDDTVHFISKYLDAWKISGTPEEAVRRSLGETGPAIVITSCILACSLLVFLGSDFVINSSIGLMLAITILFAMVFDLLCLPVCLLYLHNWFAIPANTLSSDAGAPLE